MENQARVNPGSTNPSAPIRVLVVDDSAFMRYTITRYLSEANGIQVVGAARDGQEALQLIPRLQPDVVTLDVEMPHMDGLTTLREIMAEHPRPVIMLSSLTSEGALETIQALTIGAVDFVTKPINKANVGVVMDEVVTKIQRAARARVWSVPRQPREMAVPTVGTHAKSTRSMQSNDRVVVIGSSTGGPRALNTVVPALPADLPAAVLIVQHMPVGFTRSLADRLDSLCKIKVKEAEPGDTLEVGRALLAPGGFHMVLDDNNRIALNQDPAVHGVRPAIDVTMNSVTRRFGSSVVSVILTGMGSDGTMGSGLVHAQGGYVIAEAEATCVVWGMPRSVFEAGYTDEVVPIDQVAGAIQRVLRK